MSRTFFVLFSGMAAFFASVAQASDLEAVQKAIQEAWGRHSSMTARMHGIAPLRVTPCTRDAAKASWR